MKPYVLTITLNPALDKTVTIDKFINGGLNRVKGLRIDAGGKGINVTKVLNKFDVNVIATGLIAGIQGQNILKLLSEEGIEAQFLEIPGETRTNLKVVEQNKNITTEINEPGFDVPPEYIEILKQKVSVLLENASFLVLSGSIPAGVKPDIYADFIELARSKGVRTILDADGVTLQKGIMAAPFAVKPNQHELEKLLGRKMPDTAELVQGAKELQLRGVETVVVSMGAEGALIVDKNQVLRVKTFAIKPMSTVAAGDSMVAAFVYSMLNGFSLKETAGWVSAAGTVTASKPGTQVCSLQEVENSLGLITIEQI